MAPALVGYCVGLRTDLDVVVLTVFICCGVARLARFNATVALVPKDEKGKSKVHSLASFSFLFFRVLIRERVSERVIVL